MRVLLLALLVLGSGAAPPILAAPPIQRSKRFAASGLSAPLLSSNRKGKRVSLDDVEKLAQEVAEIKSQIQTQNDNMKELMQLVAEKSGAPAQTTDDTSQAGEDSFPSDVNFL